MSLIAPGRSRTTASITARAAGSPPDRTKSPSESSSVARWSATRKPPGRPRRRGWGAPGRPPPPLGQAHVDHSRFAVAVLEECLVERHARPPRRTTHLEHEAVRQLVPAGHDAECTMLLVAHV